MENKIAENYIRKIRQFFSPAWIFLGIGSCMLIYSLLIFCNFYTPIASDFTSGGIAKGAIVPLSIFIIKYFISQTIRVRLIYKIQENDGTVVLTIYNKSTISFAKTLIPLDRGQPDYFINSLFRTRTGTIREHKAYEGTSIIKINGKKYYLVPNIFEKEVTI